MSFNELNPSQIDLNPYDELSINNRTGLPGIRNSANTQTGAYTSTTADANGTVLINSATDVAFTVSADSATGLPFVGSTINIIQMGTGKVTITPGAGVTIDYYGDLTQTKGQYAVATVKKTSANTWVASGDLQ